MLEHLGALILGFTLLFAALQDATSRIEPPRLAPIAGPVRVAQDAIIEP